MPQDFIDSEARMRFLANLTCAAMLVCLGVVPGHAEKRVALVIGNAAYRSMPRLTNPKNDAEDVGRALRDLQFETIVATDLNHSGMNNVLDRFTRAVEGADIAIVYYSGHGMQFAGANYLLPVEARLDSAADVNRFRLMPAEDVLDSLKSVPGARVLVLDACRNNPVEEDLKRQLASMPGANRDAVLTRGLVRTSAGNGLLVAYATQSNDVASDGTARNSPFTTAFIRHVGTPDIDLRQMLFRVQDDVARITAGKQRPELSISLMGEFKLKVATAAAPVNEPPPPGQTEAAQVHPVLARLLREQADAAAAKIEQFIKEIESHVGWTTQLPWSAGSIEQRRFDALRLLRQGPAITEFAQLDATGKERLRVSRLATDVVASDADLSNDPKFAEAVARKVYYGPVYFRRESEPYMTLAIAGTRRDAGVSVVEVNLKGILNVVSQLKVAGLGQVYIIDAEGHLIAHPDNSLVSRNADFSRLVQVQAAKAARTGQNTERLQVAEDFQGRRVLTAYAPLGPLGWFVFVELPPRWRS
jgi:uncharacterized caspase-like protein